ncbi:MAG TPA: hypothetical protein VLF91_01475 [Candidatus Saccharimonadales bacterium]|nr:hypothetical protein [Candidatus Saccharimonadales bacterium]
MDTLADLLSSYKSEQPPEILAIKRYIFEEFGAEASVSLQGDTGLVITVKSPALASTLRLRLRALQEVAKTEKRLIFRIG